MILSNTYEMFLKSKDTIRYIDSKNFYLVKFPLQITYCYMLYYLTYLFITLQTFVVSIKFFIPKPVVETTLHRIHCDLDLVIFVKVLLCKLYLAKGISGSLRVQYPGCKVTYLSTSLTYILCPEKV